MGTQGRGRGFSTALAVWGVSFAILILALLFVGFLEGQPFLKPIFTQQGGFFIRLLLVVGWALGTFYFNDKRARRL